MKQGHSKPPPPDIYIRLGAAFMLPADTGGGVLPALQDRSPENTERAFGFLMKTLIDFPLSPVKMKVSFQRRSGDPEKGSVSTCT